MNGILLCDMRERKKKMRDEHESFGECGCQKKSQIMSTTTTTMSYIYMDDRKGSICTLSKGTSHTAYMPRI